MSLLALLTPLLGAMPPAAAGVITAPIPEVARAPRRVALVVGVDTYADPALPDLRFAAKDAGDMAEVLRRRSAGGFDEVIALQGEVRRETLLAALRSFGGSLGKEDLFLLYFAGHGTMALKGGEAETFLMLSDGALDRPAETAISTAELSRALEALPARRRVLIVDACNSGQGRSALSPAMQQTMEQLRGMAIPTISVEIGRMDAQLFAARPTDPAVESDRLQNGVYTHFLIDALSGAGDGDGDGLVDVQEAHEWARENTMRYTAGLQIPWISVEEEGVAPIFLSGDPAARARAARALVTGLASLPASAVVRIDGQARGGGGLEAGWHEVEVEVGGGIALRDRVRVRPGERLSLEGMLARRRERLAVGMGAAYAPITAGEGWAPAISPALSLRYQPADRGGGRPSFGALLTPAYGPIADIGPLPTLQAEIAGAWLYGDRLEFGPEIAAGSLSRFTALGVQAAPIASAGLLVRGELRGKWGGLSLGVEAPLLPVDGERPWRPVASLQFGVIR